jgi:hypothetical protein
MLLSNGMKPPISAKVFPRLLFPVCSMQTDALPGAFE